MARSRRAHPPARTPRVRDRDTGSRAPARRRASLHAPTVDPGAPPPGDRRPPPRGGRDDPGHSDLRGARQGARRALPRRARGVAARASRPQRSGCCGSRGGGAGSRRVVGPLPGRAAPRAGPGGLARRTPLPRRARRWRRGGSARRDAGDDGAAGAPGNPGGVAPGARPGGARRRGRAPRDGARASSRHGSPCATPGADGEARHGRAGSRSRGGSCSRRPRSSRPWPSTSWRTFASSVMELPSGRSSRPACPSTLRAGGGCERTPQSSTPPSPPTADRGAGRTAPPGSAPVPGPDARARGVGDRATAPGSLPFAPGSIVAWRGFEGGFAPIRYSPRMDRRAAARQPTPAVSAVALTTRTPGVAVIAARSYAGWSGAAAR